MTVTKMTLESVPHKSSPLAPLKNRLKLGLYGKLFVAEMMGTFILMVFGIGSVAQFILSDGKLGSMLSINMGWGFGVVFGVYWSVGVSGGHINPAVSLAMVLTGRLKPILLPIYWAAQSIGAFLASALCYGVYKDALNNFDGGLRSTTGVHSSAMIWSTYPQDFVSNGNAFADQVFGTALLVGTVFALTDKRNNAPKSHLTPLLIGFLVMAIGMTFGMNCGYGINPARDLIPRIFTAVAGWGAEPFTAHNYWFWCPVVAQLIGGVIGAWIYILSIELHHDKIERHDVTSLASFDCEDSNGSPVKSSVEEHPTVTIQ